MQQEEITTFQRVLKQLMFETETSGTKLAEACRVNKATVSCWLKGKYFPSNDRLYIISKFFGVTVDYLLGRTHLKHEEINNYKKEEYTIPDSIDTFEEARDFLKSLNLYAYGGIDLNQKSESDIITLARTILSTLQIQGKL